MEEKNNSLLEKCVLNEYDANVKYSADYIISLYFKAEYKRNLNFSKLKKLLIIYQLWCLNYNRSGFYNSKLIVKNNHFDFNDNLSILYLSNIIEGDIKEDGVPIKDKIIEDKFTPHLYNEGESFLSFETKELLIKIFRTFGNWKNLSLRNELLSISNNISTIQPIESDIWQKKYGYIFDSNPENPIIQFIKNNPPYSKNTSREINNTKFFQYLENYFRNLSFKDKKDFINMIELYIIKQNNKKDDNSNDYQKRKSYK